MFNVNSLTSLFPYRLVETMDVFYLALCIFGFIDLVNCQYYFVISPNVIRFEHEETVTVSVLGLQNAQVKIWLQSGDKKFSEKEVVVPNEESKVNTTVLVTENDVFKHTVNEDKPRTLRIFSEWNGVTQSREVILSYRSGYLIVQTDKPIYTPQQKVRIRTLALRESLKPLLKQEIAMEIISPTNLTMARISIKESANGFFKHEFELPPYPDLGIWTARAFIKGQFETSARSQFQVDEYVLPTFGVTADVNVHFIDRTTNSICITVRAKYVYGKPVVGTARLTLNLTEKLGNTDFILGLKPAQLHDDGGVDGSVKEFNISMAQIFSSARLQGREFPDGCRLQVIATVYESATGKEETVSNDDVMFVENPYNFHFTRSKTHYRPGFEYALKVDVTYANGKPVDNIDVNITFFNGAKTENETKKTDSRGRVIAWFSTPLHHLNKLEFKVSPVGESQYSSKFEVAAYTGENQIQVEQKIDSNKMTMKAHTNMQVVGDPNRYTGMIFMVITRGKVVHTSFAPAANEKTEEITEKLQEYITPSARVLVFYVDTRKNEVVADSVKFEVEEKCRDNGLTLQTLHKEVKPADRDQLIVTGSPLMWVGLNVIDKALLLLNDKNVLRKHKMFEVLASHDLGCGEGSGKSSGDVFKKSGLTVLTNADLSDGDLQRSSDDCSLMKRRKRDADDCFGAEQICCLQGKEFGKRLFDETTEKTRLDPYTKCYAYARKLALQQKLLTKCIMAFFLTCKDTLETAITDLTKLASKSLEDETDYKKDLEKLANANVRPVTRKDFRESWLFDEVQLDNGGENKQYVLYPDSITEWRFQAIGITEDRGMCIAEELDVKAYRPFFIQLHLPYKAVRLEYLDVKATIFSYGLPIDDNKPANVYIEGVEGLCFSSEPNKPSPKISVILPPNSAQTVTFPMSPLKNGEFPIKVSAMVTEGGIPVVDVVEKKLYVVNEGVEVRVPIQVCLDPNKEMDDCKNDPRVVGDVLSYGAVPERILTVDLSLPEDSISGTGAATGYIHSNIMDNIVIAILGGVHKLFQCPHGCGEQTIATTSPNVYAMMYLKQTKQMTKEIEVTGNTHIRNGVNREITQFRHADGSYSCCLTRPTSTWLTAFVVKVFCQAKTVVDDAINKIEDIEVTINWLTNNVQPDGSFAEIMQVGRRSMVGQLKENSTALTSFVLVSLLECPIRTQTVNQTVQKTKTFLENIDRNLLRNDPYLLALTTYALAMTNSEKKWEFKTLLEAVAHKDGKEMYWGNSGGHPANAHSIENTAYALLAMLQFNDLATSASIVRWLTAQRDATGIFRSTQDTAVGLQALSMYSIRTYSPDINLEINLIGDGKQDFHITKEEAIVRRIAKNLPVERGDNRLTVKVKGSGAGRMMIDLRYNKPAKDDEICPFDVTDVEVEEIQQNPNDVNIDIANMRNCDVCGKCNEPDQPINDIDAFDIPDIPDLDNVGDFGRRKRQAQQQPEANTLKCIRFSVSSKSENKEYGMSIVEFGLETDVEVMKEDLDKLKAEDENIDMYELPSNGNGFVVFYLLKITSNKTKFIFRLKDNYKGDVSTRQPSYVKVYDYYNPDQQCTKLYGTGPNRAAGVSFRCDKDNKQCQCLQSLCAKAVDDEILRLVVTPQGRPAIQLVMYTCNPEKANYAVFVQIENVTYVPGKEEMEARGRVLKSIHKGLMNLEKDAEMAFFWRMGCDQKILEKGKQYYVIGKDGFKVGNREEFRYPLMGTTLIVKKLEEKRIRLVMDAYTRLMAEKGCLSK